VFVSKIALKAYKTSIIHIGDSRRGHLKERGDDTFQRRVEQGNLDSNVIVSTVKFYDNNHNSQSNCWIGLKMYLKFPGIVFYVREKFQVNRSLERPYDVSQNRLNEFCYLLFFLFVNFLFGNDHFPTRMW